MIYDDVRIVIVFCQVPRFELLVHHQSWGITLSHVRTRRAPNAFNFLRQLEILKKSGSECGMSSFEVLRLWLRWKSHFCWIPRNECFLNSHRCVVFRRLKTWLQEWTSATAFQKAFEIGEGEAQAVVNLLGRIPEEIVADLQAAVRVRGMRNWISHQMLARDIFNVGFSSAVGTPYESWGERLVNGADNALATCPSSGKLLSKKNFLLAFDWLWLIQIFSCLQGDSLSNNSCFKHYSKELAQHSFVFSSRFQVKLFVKRLKMDWDKLPNGLKKVYSWKDAVCLHAICGAFLSLLNDLKHAVPSADYHEAETLLLGQFELGYLDPEIENLLSARPPAVGEVEFFRRPCDGDS